LEDGDKSFFPPPFPFSSLRRPFSPVDYDRPGVGIAGAKSSTSFLLSFPRMSPRHAELGQCFPLSCAFFPLYSGLKKLPPFPSFSFFPPWVYLQVGGSGLSFFFPPLRLDVRTPTFPFSFRTALFGRSVPVFNNGKTVVGFFFLLALDLEQKLSLPFGKRLFFFFCNSDSSLMNWTGEGLFSSLSFAKMQFPPPFFSPPRPCSQSLFAKRLNTEDPRSPFFFFFPPSSFLVLLSLFIFSSVLLKGVVRTFFPDQGRFLLNSDFEKEGDPPPLFFPRSFLRIDKKGNFPLFFFFCLGRPL